jgi:DNA polymerase V
VTRLFALVDCNNFYASCERLFDPRLNGKPIVVLSNNDGCVIARSNEAKALGIPMGEPLFKVRQLVEKHDVRIFSSNYTLYGDMSRRVMEMLARHCADVEIYSIDEAFLELRFAGQTESSLIRWAEDLRYKVGKGVGIPVSIGIGPTKVLAKLANHIAKKRTTSGVYAIQADAPILKEITIDEVWGVGRAYCRRLAPLGIETVDQLAAIDQRWMRSEFGVVGLRLVRELNGQVCEELEPPLQGRKNTMVSRSFARDIYDLGEIERRLALYATRLGEKLRQYDQAATTLTIYLWANPHRNEREDGRVCFSRSIELPVASNHTNELISRAIAIGRGLYEEGTNYKKAGIMAGQLVPAAERQGNLFADQPAVRRSDALMQALDAINRKQGGGAAYFASCGHSTRIPLRTDYKSPCYTTRWENLLRVK